MLLNRERDAGGRAPRALMAGPTPGIALTTFREQGGAIGANALGDGRTHPLDASERAFPLTESGFNNMLTMTYTGGEIDGSEHSTSCHRTRSVHGWTLRAGCLGRQCKSYEKSRMIERKCAIFAKGKIGSAFYRTETRERRENETPMFRPHDVPQDY
ncbi:hypothetical protein CYMTET_12396 [Cymbomonas tetramitiformis]|uniref:Uncharacterized protein n=1 Tax=Cymbomonas tetramitiformis TaxID=36881 RepID=A0AAE0LCG8_9CHLO|nr:hypothetical protein CYMTET_12396 [Cymbomonas tetramitiformis]